MRLRLHAAVLLSSVTLATAACGGDRNKGTSTVPAAATTVTPVPTAGAPAPVTVAPGAATAPATAAAPVTPEHHSKLAGAAAGALAGRAIGGKKGMLIGAAAGAYIQHRRNKAARQAAAAGNP